MFRTSLPARVEAVQLPRRTTYPPLFQVMLTNPPPLTVSQSGSLARSPFEFGSAWRCSTCC
jgi:hypothetical protein